MFGYGSKLGGVALSGGRAIVAVAAAAGIAAGWGFRASSPDLAHWAIVLSAGLILGSFVGQVLGGRWSVRRAPVPVPSAAIALEPGQIVPWDAVILEGESEVDNGALGGSAFAMPVAIGAQLRQGARNGDGSLRIAPQTAGVAGMPQPGSKAPFPEFVETHAIRILLAMLVLAAAAAIRIDATTAALAVAAAVPPSLGLIRAIVFDAARRKALSIGIDWRDAGSIDALANVDSIVLAPGGILTRPDLSLLSLHPAPDFKPADVIAAAVTCCQSSHSSLARAALRFAVTHRVRLRAIESWRAERSDIGGGIVAKVDLGAELALGDRDWLERHGLPAAAFDAVNLPPAAPGRRLIWIAELAPQMNLLGALTFGERLKTGGGELAKSLKRLGIETVLHESEASLGQLELTRQLGLKPSDAGLDARRALLVDRTGAAAMATQAAMQGGAAWVHFGLTQAQGQARPLAAIRREDPRVILDLLRLARATRRRETIATLLAFAFCLPPVWFALGGRVGLECAVLSPVLGLAAVVVSAQFLHLFQPTASEVDEE